MALDIDAARQVILDSLPVWPDPKWAAWVDGVLDRLAECCQDVTLSTEEKATIIDALRDIPEMDERMARIRPSRQLEIDERRALAARLEAAQ